MNARFVVLALVVACSGCGTAQRYAGPRRCSQDVARTTGDMRINAGSPLTLVLREVDNTPLNIGQNSVEVLPGKHRFLVDCRIAETEKTSRHSVEEQVRSE